MAGTEGKPAWLVRMENGSIGEARTRAFLLDRFWILERSVDVEGADLIIQRRLTTQNLLDTEPPRLGVVQVKFFQDAGTSQYIHREYVVGPDGKPRKEFFVLCHTGTEDAKRMFFLSAEVIEADFKVVKKPAKQAGKYILSGAAILGSQKYEVVQPSLVLDRIERALRNAGFASNRKFLSWALPVFSEVNPAIKPDYEEPLHNWYGDIPEAFAEMKKNASRSLLDVEEFADLLREIVLADDPEQACDAAEAIGTTHGYRVEIPDNLHDEDMFGVVKEHKRRLATLKASGLLDRYFRLQRIAGEAIISDLLPRVPLRNETDVCVLTTHYEPDSLAFTKLAVRVVPKTDKLLAQSKDVSDVGDDDRTDRFVGERVLSESPGKVCVCYSPHRHVHRISPRRAYVEDFESLPWVERLKASVWQPVEPIMDAVFRQRFGADRGEPA
jgi:hypothetical protein